MRYSALSIFLNGLFGNRNWAAHWRQPEPKPHYDVIIVGGGGHGLATAYYLSKTFGIRNIAVVEKGYIGSGNVGRNTTIIRSNYLLPGNNPFYEFSMKLWEGLDRTSISTPWCHNAASSISSTRMRSAMPIRARQCHAAAWGGCGASGPCGGARDAAVFRL